MIDFLGLTDAYVAREGHDRPDAPPGHRRRAPKAYLQSRGVQLARARCASDSYASITRLTFLTLTERHYGDWCLLRYDPQLAALLEERAPELVEFVNFQEYLDGYRDTRSHLNPDRIEKELRFFDVYYFEQREDPSRRDPIVRALAVKASSVETPDNTLTETADVHR